MNLSQSMIKDFWAYKEAHLCGKLFKEKYITKTVTTPSSELALAGQWFEYVSTGSLPRECNVPKTELKKTGEKSRPEWERIIAEASASLEAIKPAYLDQAEIDMPLLYSRLLRQANHLKQAFRYYGVDIITTGEVITSETIGIYTWKGILDVRATMKLNDSVQEVIIDLKSTGLINDRWKETGWDTDTLPGKRNLLLQPIFYRLITKRDIPFLFFVHSSSNDIDRKIIRVDMSEKALSYWLSEIKIIEEEIEECIAFDSWTYYPDVKNCSGCPCWDKCIKRTSVPRIHTIYLI